MFKVLDIKENWSVVLPFFLPKTQTHTQHCLESRAIMLHSLEDPPKNLTLYMLCITWHKAFYAELSFYRKESESEKCTELGYMAKT